jgi:hypothetical protein
MFRDAAKRLRFGMGGAVDVGAALFIAPDQPLCGHDLQELQNGGVPGAARHLRQDLPHRAWPALPEDPQNRGFCFGRQGFASHGREYTITFVFVNEGFRG